MFSNILVCLNRYQPVKNLRGCVLPMKQCEARKINPMINQTDQPILLFPALQKASPEAGVDLGASDR